MFIPYVKNKYRGLQTTICVNTVRPDICAKHFAFPDEDCVITTDLKNNFPHFTISSQTLCFSFPPSALPLSFSTSNVFATFYFSGVRNILSTLTLTCDLPSQKVPHPHKVELSSSIPLRHIEGGKVGLHSFLTSAVGGG